MWTITGDLSQETGLKFTCTSKNPRILRISLGEYEGQYTAVLVANSPLTARSLQHDLLNAKLSLVTPTLELQSSSLMLKSRDLISLDEAFKIFFPGQVSKDDREVLNTISEIKNQKLAVQTLAQVRELAQPLSQREITVPGFNMK